MEGDTPALTSTAGIALLLDEHWDALDADFRRYYQLDLEACCFGPGELGVRRIKAYISHLPTDSSLARAMGWSWDEMREMTATLVELEVNRRRTSRADPIFKYPRPSELLDAIEETPAPLTVNGLKAALLGPTRG